MIDLDPGTPEPASVAAPEPVVIAQNPPRGGGGFVSVLLFVLILALGACMRPAAPMSRRCRRRSTR
jgi:hypothetical protein